ncbi:MAG: hypothetical protein WKG01_11995 [Kofleriaceae bacterium]
MRAQQDLRWVWRGGALALLVIGWAFIALHNNFHITPPVVFIGLGYLAAITTIYNLFQTGASAVAANEEDAGEADWGRPIGKRGELEREKRTLLKAIKEAEFDHQMGKLSDADADAMIQTYRARAIQVIRELEDPGMRRISVRDDIQREVRVRLEVEAHRNQPRKRSQKASEAAIKAARAAASVGAPGAVAAAMAKAAADAADADEPDVRDEPEMTEPATSTTEATTNAPDIKPAGSLSTQSTMRPTRPTMRPTTHRPRLSQRRPARRRRFDEPVNRFMLVVALGCAALASHSLTPVYAQPAEALGKPLPDGSMAVGSVSIRVVAGTPTASVVGTEVTLSVNNEPRAARTDSSGRAMFAGLPAGAVVQAKVADAEGKPITSEEFPVPASGGVKVMLSTKPFTGGAGPAMPAGGVPEARQMSGQPRPEPKEPVGQFTIRLTYNNIAMVDKEVVDNNPPVGETVTLVGYAADDSVIVKPAKIDASGRVTFADLDPSGSVVYFAMALLPRAGGYDRLMTQMPIQLDGQMGARAILSGDKRDATSPAIDELPLSTPTPAGKLRVTLEESTEMSTVTLVDAATKAIITKGTPTAASTDAGEVQGRAAFEAQPGTKPGALEVMVKGGAAGAAQPLGGVPIYIVPADAQSLDGATPQPSNADGRVTISGPTSGSHKAVFVVNGRALVSDPFSLDTSGGRLDILAQWTASGKPEIVFDVAAKPGQVVYAETTVKGQIYRSLPVQPIPAMGASVQIFVTPVVFRFGLRAVVEDEYLGVQGRFIIENPSWKPFRAGPDGLLIPLPRGHKGGQVADMNQAEVSVAAGEGLRILRPIAPGRKMVVGAFSLPIRDGSVSWRLDLPYGLAQSGMEIKQTPGMRVQLPPGMPGQTVCVRDDKPVTSAECKETDEKWFVLDGIAIAPQQAMVFSVHGLPAAPGWRLWAPRIVGVVVLMLMIGGVVFALLRKGTVTADLSQQRSKLLDELVELERTGQHPKRREQVMAELEKLWT